MPRRAETDDPLVKALGRAVLKIRAERGLTQTQLGSKAEIHPTWISHIESGRVNPTFMNLARISRGLDLRMSELVSRVEEELR
jgi:transcriptional regulator with XRE-family HTH domain